MKINSVCTSISTAILAALLLCSPALAADQASDWKVGAGYQAMWAGEFLNGISARAWYQDRFVGEIKLMYAPIVREYSKFYIGAQGSIGQFELDGDLIDYKDEIYGFGVFIGSEFHFQEIPELGFNFDVGYKHYFYEDKPYGSSGPEVDIELKGVGATFGIHYYF